MEIKPQQQIFKPENPIVTFPDTSYNKTGGGEKTITIKNKNLPENIESLIGLPEGGRVKVEVIYSEAAASAKIDLLMRQPTSMTILEYANQNIGFQWESDIYEAGTNVEFGIYWTYNHWGMIYEGNEAGAVVEQLNSRQYQIGYEAAGDDWDYNELVVLVTIEDYELLVEIEPTIIRSGEEAMITVKKQYLDGRVEEFPAGQMFEAGMMEGCAAGGLVNGADTTAYIYGIVQPIKFVAADSLENEDEMVRIGVGLSGTGEGIKLMKQKAENKSKEQIEKQGDTNTELIIGEYCFPGNFVSDRVGEGTFTVQRDCSYGAPICINTIELPLGFKEEVVEWTGTYTFLKEGYRPKQLNISSGGETYLLEDGSFKVIPINAPTNDPIYGEPISGSFYSPYEMETCYNQTLNNGKGAYQFKYKALGRTDNYIYKPIIIQVADYGNNLYAMKSVNDLATIPIDTTCRALIDFEYGRYRKSYYDDDHFFNKLDIIYEIVEAYWEHEKYHKRSALAFLNEKYDKEKIKVPDPNGSVSLKTLKQHLQTTVKCSQNIKNYNDAKRLAEKYFEDAFREYAKYFINNWYGIKDDIYHEGQWKVYIIEELYAHWSDSVQKKITKYQSLLASRQGFNPAGCSYNFKKLWEPFKKYRNNR
ncbi:Hypothetical protein IALB_3014 [Ignavibacterium album JCM 16511]|uniref:Uncharacterized protein n=1 Tax=Ignavibacterium album (strain DSM 19864 / JCM 16511 / NBRC 101810 / Mat9-16) TaxID=945713 RepID=I0AP10_IGNAJ|nr:hypothetical protein [Ignavibacterium album]AFH50717.1 Hypothetical protein IALB_3014 [Ignavibacterium album JCM 16511]